MRVCPDADVAGGLLETFILLPALNFLLHQRGLFLVHASVVEINGAAVAFAGRKGWGKSTLAAHLTSRGHALMSDDNLVIDLETGDRPLALPGFPQTRLWPDALASLGLAPDNLPRIYPALDKRVGQLGSRFRESPAPLAAIYLLETAATDAVEIAPLAGQEAFRAILSFSYAGDVASGGFDLLAATGSRARHFQQSAQVASRVPLRTLRRPLGFPEMERVVECIERDVESLTATAPPSPP